MEEEREKEEKEAANADAVAQLEAAVAGGTAGI